MSGQEWMSGEPVCYMLLVSSTYQISLMVGDYQKVFQTDLPHIFPFQASITELDWKRLFSEEPDLNLEQQILYTHDQQKILLSITKVDKKEFEFVFSFTNLTRCSKLLMVGGQLNVPLSDQGLIWHSEKMKQILYIIEQITQVDSTVLLLGESGVGKSAIAKAMHQMSLRKDGPFVSINCGSLAENLIESELFGYESGSFTGGKKGGKAGLFEAAHQGTIFLDEIAELPYGAQSKLLEVLQEGTFHRIGGVKKIQVDVRVIAATNKDLDQMIKQNQFREDLFYRLNVLPLKIPPLRERTEEIPVFIDYFLKKFNKKYKKAKWLSESTMDRFAKHHWPGNIRELENVIERIVVTGKEENFDFSITNVDVTTAPPEAQEEVQGEIVVRGILPLKQAKRQVEKELVYRAYKAFGSTYKAAKALEVDQSTIVKKMKDYNLPQDL